MPERFEINCIGSGGEDGTMTGNKMERLIRRTLLKMGARPDYAGFRYAVYALHLALEEEERLWSVTKRLYSETAEHYQITYGAVERGLRTLIDRMWRENRELITEELSYPFLKRPTVGEFFAVMIMNLEEQEDGDFGE